MLKLLFILSVLLLSRETSGATCIFSLVNAYTCNLYDVNVQSESDELVIAGNHLSDYNDTLVTSIVVTNFSMIVLHKNILDTFPNAEVLFIAPIGLQRIPDQALDSCRNLTQIQIEENPLTTLQARVFASCDALVLINIRSGQLRDVSPEAFYGLTNLVILDLDNNQITSLDAGVFDQKPLLVMVSLRENKLTRLESAMFASIENLGLLYLQGNPIEEIESSTFEGSSSLLQLELQNCNITKIHPDAFKSLGKLTTLYLQNNKLRTFESGTFTPLTGLSTINLQGNQIKRLNSNAFGQHVNATTFNINLNQLDEVESDLFSHFPNVNYISALGNTCIDKIVTNMSWIPEQFEECFSNWVTPRTTSLPTTSTQGSASLQISSFLLGIVSVTIFVRKFC